VDTARLQKRATKVHFRMRSVERNVNSRFHVELEEDGAGWQHKTELDGDKCSVPYASLLST